MLGSTPETEEVIHGERIQIWRGRLYLFLGTAITNYYNLGDLKQQKGVLTVLEAQSMRSRCWQGHHPPEVLGRDSFLASSSFWYWDALV